MWRIVPMAAVVAGVMMLASTATAPAEAAASGTLSASSASGAVGETVQMNIDVSNMAAPGLGAWTIDIIWDPSRVTPTTRSQHQRDCEAEPYGVCNMQFGSATGRFAGASAIGLIGDFGLGTTFFQCLVPGTNIVSLSANVFADATVGDPQDIDVSIQNATITCAEPTSTALPPATATPAAVLPPAGYGDDERAGAPIWLTSLLALSALTLAVGALVVRRRRSR